MGPGGGGKKACVNASCGATTTREWKRGWPLRSGDFALLCFSCGSAYESSVYCDNFHSEESGWRECYICNKRLHCGCIASESLLQLLDYGGVGCARCARIYRSNLIQNHEIPNGLGSLPTNNIGNLVSLAGKRVAGNGTNDGKLAQLCRLMEASETNMSPQAEVGESSADPGKISNEVGICLSNGSQPSAGSYKFPNQEKLKTILDMGEICGSLSQPSLRMTLGAPSFTKNFVPFASGDLKDKELGSPSSSFQQAPKSRSAPPKPSKSGTSASSDSNKVSPSEPRIARPPAEGRGKNQLLPRYWPRITDQELQQLSGDLNSNIVPLFEKVLSASDAGRIGRLVLPKACAEAYFPTISQSEGLPIRIQDIKGREWTFQFRFWPNNNSRMYVLEGVTPCIQSMQLQAGDTITFSKIDPGGRLVLGYRKATNNAADTQEDQASTILNGTPCGETILPADMDVGWNQTESQGVGTNKNSLQQGQQLATTAEKKKAWNIGPKNKRLLMNGEDAMELRLTWEEAQDLLRPPPNVNPTVIAIDDYEFEEYDEPPVFGKRTIFTTRPSGRQDQWAQCDECYKWRKLPVDALLPAKWSCSENIWDSIRCSCSAEEEMNPKDMDNLLRLSRDFKKRRTIESRLRPFHDAEPSGLDALASVAVLGENIGGLGEPSVGATTKHPRHRPGCTCIVCIQPPSGKGKHKPTCTCNVCMTVKRRFKTLMLRKKKRQLERESEVSRKENLEDKDRPETNGTSSNEVADAFKLDIDGNQARKQPELAETSSGQIDLNYCPDREETQPDAQGPSVVMQLESLSLDNGSKPDEPGSSKNKQQGSMSPSTLSHTNGESLRQLSDHEAFLASIGWEQPNKGN